MSTSLTLIYVNTYTDLGQLTCVLCKTIVRSETVWPVHLNSKVHKENVALAKKTKLETESKPSNVTTFKRPPSPTEETANKKIKGILKNSNQPTVQTKSSLPADFFDNNSKQVNGSKAIIPSAPTQESKDSMVEVSMVEAEEVEEEKEKEKAKDSNVAALPEGFFDDPVMDAKVRQQQNLEILKSDIRHVYFFVLQVRNVEYKDPIEEEYEKFQKEIKEEAAQSAQIIADDQEEATTERQLDEIEEQIRRWSR